MKKATNATIRIGTIMLAFSLLFLTGCPFPNNTNNDAEHKRVPKTEELTIKAPEVNDTVDGATDFDRAFDNILSNNNWGKVNTDAITFDNGVYKFDAKYQTGSIIRKIIIKEGIQLSFKIQTSLNESYDGYLQFIVDGSIWKSYTGFNGNWLNQQFEITPGTHTIEWRRYDDDDRASENSPFVSVKDFQIKRSQNVIIPAEKDITIDAPEVKDSENGSTNLSIAFDNILSNPNWGKVNPDAISYKDGIYTFDAKEKTGCIKRTIILSEPKRLTFKIKTHLYEIYDGCLQFLIDDVIIQQYSDESETWNEQQFELSAGSHTIEWRRYDIDTRWTIFGNSDIPPYVSLKDFAFKDSLTAITSLTQTFDDTLNSEMWTGTGLTANIIDRDPIFAKWPQYGDALVDTHGKVYQLACAKGEGDNIITGNSSLTIQKITVTEESAISFDYKCDLLDWTDNNGILHQNYLKVYLDYAKNPAFTAIGYGQMWQKASIILPAGTHTVKFVCGTDDNWYGNRMTNSTFLDNITLTANSIASVDIYPKGLQETYVNGDSIQFTAKALRSDGSVIPDMNVSWTSSGGSIDAKGLFTPGTSKGTFTVTASIAGKSASNQTVKVHGSDYLTEPVTINGHIFTGKITPIDNTARSNTANITWADPTPAYSNFTTDGFFVLKGTAANDKYVLATIVKLDDDDTTYLENNPDYPYITQYLMKPGDFEQRIWLRYGDGNYEVYIYEEVVEKCPDYGVYEGAFLNWHWTNEADSQTFFRVKNQTGLNWSADDSAFLMPSGNIQSDNFLVSNAFNAVMAELPSNATLGQKLQALYDWEARRSHYDYVSFSNNQSTNKRKKQDAVSVLKYEMAVCEGYADLYTAFARLLGVKAAFQGSQYFNHAWTELYYKGQWKMVDITWDDPSPEGSTEKNPTAENYTYFLIDPADASHIPEGKDSPDKKIDYSRTISVSSQKEFASSSY